mmetsp:Transcript_18703/g.49594  ORF Transcript_18703/g.49594 Transcript_18703/m.49594 type:complete len:218 (+) Transcript_18703:819-1472(+)
MRPHVRVEHVGLHLQVRGRQDRRGMRRRAHDDHVRGRLRAAKGREQRLVIRPRVCEGPQLGDAAAGATLGRTLHDGDVLLVLLARLLRLVGAARAVVLRDLPARIVHSAAAVRQQRGQLCLLLVGPQRARLVAAPEVRALARPRPARGDVDAIRGIDAGLLAQYGQLHVRRLPATLAPPALLGAASELHREMPPLREERRILVHPRDEHVQPRSSRH